MGCRGCGGGSPAAAGSARWPVACSAGGLVTIGLAGGLRVCPTAPRGLEPLSCPRRRRALACGLGRGRRRRAARGGPPAEGATGHGAPWQRECLSRLRALRLSSLRSETHTALGSADQPFTPALALSLHTLPRRPWHGSRSHVLPNPSFVHHGCTPLKRRLSALRRRKKKSVSTR